MFPEIEHLEAIGDAAHRYSVACKVERWSNRLGFTIFIPLLTLVLSMFTDMCAWWHAHPFLGLGLSIIAICNFVAYCYANVVQTRFVKNFNIEEFRGSVNTFVDRAHGQEEFSGE